MKANELRIGNLVKKGNDLCTVKGYYDNLFIVEDNEKIEFKSNVFDNIKPIPLIEEWLLKFGFEKFKGKLGDVYCLIRNEFEIYFKIEHWNHIECKDSIYFNNWFIKYTIHPHKIEYIHQLQNLYFALNGQELTISNAN